MIKFEKYRIIESANDFISSGFENEFINQPHGKIDFYDNNNYPLALVYIADWFGEGYFIDNIEVVKNEIKNRCEMKISQYQKILNCLETV